MSLNETQIRQLVREEVRRIIDAGLMYTTESKPQTTPQPPTTAPSPSLLKWEQMPPTEKGPWERTLDITNPKIQQIIAKLDQGNRPIFCEDGVYWLLTKDGKIEGVGRRVKA